MSESLTFSNWDEFYVFYLQEHSNAVCRRLHFIGSSIALTILMAAAWTRNPWLILLALVQGYAFSWVGHFFFERNKPATFLYPFYSFISDWRMWSDILRGKVAF